MLVATATESSNLDSADTAVDITGRFVAVADEMVVSVAETTARAREDEPAYVTVTAASLVDTDGSETGAVYLATNASAGELAVVYLVNGSSRVELETIEGYMHHHESSARTAAATLYNMTVTPEHSYSYGCTCGCACPYEPTTCDEALVMSGHDSTATDSFAGCASDCDDCVLQYLASEIGCSHVYDNISSFNCDLAYDDMGSSLDDTGSWNDDMGGHRQLSAPKRA